MIVCALHGRIRLGCARRPFNPGFDDRVYTQLPEKMCFYAVYQMRKAVCWNAPASGKNSPEFFQSTRPTRMHHCFPGDPGAARNIPRQDDNVRGLSIQAIPPSSQTARAVVKVLISSFPRDESTIRAQ
jgi:hypothetical protein